MTKIEEAQSKRQTEKEKKHNGEYISHVKYLNEIKQNEEALYWTHNEKQRK